MKFLFLLALCGVSLGKHIHFDGCCERTCTYGICGSWRCLADGAVCLGYWVGRCFNEKCEVMTHVDVVFNTDAVQILETTPDYVDSSTTDNPTSATLSKSIEWAVSTTRSSSFEQTSGISVTAGVEVETTVSGGFGGLFEASVGITFSLSTTLDHSFTYGKEKSTTREWSYSTTVYVPPFTEIRYTAVLTKAKLNIPYTGTVHFESGLQKTITGTWIGVDSGNLVNTLSETTHKGCFDETCNGDIYCDWVDVRYDSCSVYKVKDWCEESFVPSRAVDGVDALAACCSCGGGHAVGITYVGCFGDTSTRALGGIFRTDTSNTLESCATFCSGYNYFGLQYGSYCFCGYSGYDTYGSSTGCNMPCTGDSSEICGGSWANSVYRFSEVISSDKGMGISGSFGSDGGDTVSIFSDSADGAVSGGIGTCYDEGCKNIPDCYWVDNRYVSCAEYEFKDWCDQDFVPLRAVGDVDAKTACCACGGGHQVSADDGNDPGVFGGFTENGSGGFSGLADKRNDAFSGFADKESGAFSGFADKESGAFSGFSVRWSIAGVGLGGVLAFVVLKVVKRRRGFTEIVSVSEA